MLSEYAVAQRRLALEGTHNVRDLGGYTTEDGRHVRWRTLLRADKLDHLSIAAQQALIQYGIRTIIDLRYQPEVISEPDVFVDSKVVRYVHMPLYQLTGDSSLPSVPDDLEDLYRLIVDHRSSQIRSIIEELVRPHTMPALVHCTAGKDRTGLVVAIILKAIGVPADTIVEDYILSALYLSDLLNELRAQAKVNGYDSDWYERLLLCRPETMAHTLSYISQRYGDAVNYLAVAGLPQETLDTLIDLLVE